MIKADMKDIIIEKIKDIDHTMIYSDGEEKHRLELFRADFVGTLRLLSGNSNKVNYLQIKL